MVLPVLPYEVVIPIAALAGLAAAGVLADADPHPVAAARRAVTTVREHAARAAVTVALTVACAAQPARRGVA